MATEKQLGKTDKGDVIMDLEKANEKEEKKRRKEKKNIELEKAKKLLEVENAVGVAWSLTKIFVEISEKLPRSRQEMILDAVKYDGENYMTLGKMQKMIGGLE